MRSVRAEAPTLLLLAFYFPPNNIVGAVRPHQIAEYFVNHGWRVVVVCSEAAHIPWNSGLSTSSFAVRRIPEPSLLAWAQSSFAHSDSPKGQFSWVSRYARRLLRCLAFPDLERLARRRLRSEALAAIEEHRPDLILSTAPPFSVHVVAAELASRCQIPWVADNRDIWSGTPYRRCRLPRELERNYERSVLRSANWTIGVTRAMVRHYSELMDSDSVSLAMNGYPDLPPDASARPKLMATDQFVVLYAGSMYGGRRELGPLLEAASDDHDISKRSVIKLIGVEAPVVDELQRQFPRIELEALPYMSQASVAAHCAAADVLVVAQTNHPFDKGVIPGKFFFYLQFGRPILAIGDPESELGELIHHYDLGICSRDPQVITAFLQGLISGRQPRVVTPPECLSSSHQLQLLFEVARRLAAEAS